MMEKQESQVAIIGYGWVGKAMKTLFPDALVYDPLVNSSNFRSCSGEEVNQAGIAFVCTPTPNIGEGKLDVSIVEEVVSWISCPLLIIRSTVNPGTCDYLSQKYHKRIVFQPEFLGETVNHPMANQKERPWVILGGSRENTRKVIELYTTIYNANTKIREVTAYEAEVIKLTENRAIAFKVSQCQELYDVCERAGVDYYTVRDAVYGDDPRFNLWWTFVYPEKRGANSKCIPKDVYAWCAWAESFNYQPEITRAILERNKKWITP